MSLFNRFFAAAVFTAAVFLCSTSAMASGYLLNEFSVTSMGRAFAGVGVVGDDLSAIGTNPAGMQLMKDTFRVQLGATAITLNGTFKGDVSSNGTPLGNGSTRVEIQAVVPNFFAAYSITDDLKVGFGVYVPFGLGTEYPESSIVRYNAVKSDLQVIELAPSISYNIWRGLTIGATVNVQHGAATLTQKMPINHPVSGAYLGDANVDVQGDDWAVGGTVGIMYDFGATAAGDATRIGLAYRSQVDHKLKGDMDVTSSIINTSTGVTAMMHLPNVVTLSAYHKLKAPVGLSATLRYIQWSCFDELEIKGSGTPAVQEQWRDTVSAHVGADWFVNDYVVLRAGVAYDMTPVKNAEYLTARVPDSNRVLVSLGLTAMLSKNWLIDIGYTHMFLEDRSINNTHGGLTQHGKYSYDLMSYLMGAQVQFKF